MKYSLLIAGASACHMNRMHMRHEWCPALGQEDVYTTHVFMRKAASTYLEASFAATFENSVNPNDERCMGEWMDGVVQKNIDTMHRLFHGDIWGVSHEDLKEITNSSWDMVFDNIEYCQAYKYMYWGYNWCNDNIEVCKLHQGVAGNVVENAIPIAGEIFKLWNIMWSDWTCMTDDEILNTFVYEGSDAVSQIAKMVWNFHEKIDLSVEPTEKLTMREMHHNLHNKAKALHMPKEHPFMEILGGAERGLEAAVVSVLPPMPEMTWSAPIQGMW